MVRNVEFGRWLRERRIDAGLLQEEVAEALGVTHPTISRWEAGKNRPPLEMINKLAATLRVAPGVVVQQAGVDVMPTRESRLPRELLSDLLEIQDDARSMEIVMAVARSQRLLLERPGEPRRR